MQNSSCCSKSKKNRNTALLVLRIAVGAIFIVHGYGKLFGNAPGMEAFTGMVAGMGFPLPSVFAYAAAISEFVGGIAILLGVWTKLFSSLILIVMLVAIIGVKKMHLPAADPDVALLAIVIALVLMGPGKYSLSAKWKKTDASNGEEQKSCCSTGTPNV